MVIICSVTCIVLVWLPRGLFERQALWTRCMACKALREDMETAVAQQPRDCFQAVKLVPLPSQMFAFHMSFAYSVLEFYLYQNQP